MSGTPAIRFRGFTDPWEQCKLDELVTIERGGSPRPIESYITDEPDGLNWVKIGDAPSMGRYITSTSEKIRPEGLSKTRQVYPGDLILSNSMSFGRPYIMAVEGCIHDGWLLVRDSSNSFDQKYLCHMLGTPAMFEQYRQLAAGSTVNNLNKELVGGATVSIPAIEEQERIGTFLESLDNLITLHQRKYDRLVVLKKALLDKMFPHEGSRFPELRFHGFTDPWEQRKLGELGEFNPKTSLPESFEYVDLESVVGTDMIGHRRENRATAPSRAQRLAKTGDIFYQTVRPYQKNNYLYELPDEDFVFSTGYAQIRPSIDSSFLFCLLQQDSFVADVLDRCTGTSYPAINANDLADIEVAAPPDIDEQREIGRAISSLDNLITLHQRKLDVLKNLKSACLEKMFV